MVTLVIIDHHAPIRQALAQRLSRIPDIQVVGMAADGQEGIAQVRAHHPDIVLLEPKLPHGDGLDVLRAIRADSPASRVIVLTSYLDEFEEQTTKKAGAKHYLLKDIDTMKLAGVILGHDPEDSSETL